MGCCDLAETRTGAVRPPLDGPTVIGAGATLCRKAKGESVVANTSRSQSLALAIAGAALIITLILFMKIIHKATALAFPDAQGMPDSIIG
jgi:hypothetical protein